MHLKTRAILGVATVGAAIGAALVPATTAVAATPTVNVTWANQAFGLNLQNGDTVTVTGSGFKASSPVYLVECSGVTGQADCDLASFKQGATDGSGNFTVSGMPVHTGTVGDGTCNANSTCYIAASTDQTGQDLSQAGAGQMQFDRLQVATRSNLKNGQSVAVVGAGYKANATVYLSECTGSDPTKALQDCNTTAPGLQTMTADGNGNFSGNYVVHTGQVNSDGSKCDWGKSCFIAGSDNVVNPAAADAHIGGALVKFAVLKSLSVTAKANHSHIAKGKTFKISGKALSGSAGVKGLKAGLFKASGSKIASTTTGTGGAYVFSHKQKKTTKYVVKIAAQKGYKAAVSKTVKVSTP